MTRAYQTIVAGTKEQLVTAIYSRVTPIGTAPDWAVVGLDENEPDAGSALWKAGEWSSAGWSARTGVAEPVSTFVGAGQAHDVARGSTYKVFVRWHDGLGLPVKFVGLLVVD